MSRLIHAFTLALCCFGLVIADSTVVQFPRGLTAPVEAAVVTSSAGQSDIECATKCAVLQPCCAAIAFVPETKLCLLSAAWGADFSAAAPGRPVYRRQLLRPRPMRHVGERSFIVIQQRLCGVLSFARPWAEYEAGFGDDTDFWLGLRSIHELTGDVKTRLRVEAVTWSNVLFVAEYAGFTVSNAQSNYTLRFGIYLTGKSNTTSNSLKQQAQVQFSTKDRDNDLSSTACSADFGNGGWWYKNCSNVNPNGIYRFSAVADATSMAWKGATSKQFIALKSIRLMLEVV